MKLKLERILQSDSKLCKMFARILQNVNPGRKLNHSPIVLKSTFEANFCSINKLKRWNTWKNVQSWFKTLQESCKLFILENFFCVFLETKTNWKPNELLLTRIWILINESNWFFPKYLSNGESGKNLASFLRDFEFKYEFKC